MATIKKYNGSTWENTTARKYETKSEIIVPPTTIYADGSNITTYTIKGNTVQNGTPTPSAPIVVQGVGELDSGDYKIPILNGQQTINIYLTEQLMKIDDTIDSLASTGTVTRALKKWVWDGTENWRFDTTPYILRSAMANPNMAYSKLVCTHFTNDENGITNGNAYSFQIRGYLSVSSDLASWKQWLSDQYAAGTPVTVYYILATAQTETVTAPSIPTTDGANSITVDTTVQPSEFTATWTGWHDAEVKEWDGSQWG